MTSDTKKAGANLNYNGNELKRNTSNKQYLLNRESKLQVKLQKMVKGTNDERIWQQEWKEDLFSKFTEKMTKKTFGYNAVEIEAP